MPEDGHGNNWTGGAHRGRKSSVPRRVTTYDDGKNVAMDTSLPEDALLVDDLLKLASERRAHRLHYPLDQARVSLRGIKIAGPLGKLKKDDVALFVFPALI